MADDMRSLLGWEEPQAPETPGIDSTYVNKPAEGPGLWTSVTESWKLSRDLDSTGGAISRINEQSAFKLDLGYNLENLDDMLKQVPEVMQSDLANQLLDAKSEEHAQWITSRYLEEMAAQRELSDFGATGIVTRIGANIFDESALLGIALGPVAFGHKVTRIGRALGVGVFAAGENALQEAVVAASSPTRTAEDVGYAAMFGFIFGGAIGSIGKGSARASEPPPKVRRTTGETDTPPAPRAPADEPELTVHSNPVEVAVKSVEEMDKATIRIIKGEPVPRTPAPLQADIRLKQEALAEDLGIPVRMDEPVVTPKAEPEVPATAARVVEIEARMAELRKTVVDTPVKPTLAAEINKVTEARAALKAAEASADRVAKTRADQAFQQAKRHAMNVLRKENPDAYNQSGLSSSPTTPDFLKWLDTKGAKVMARMEKDFIRDTEKYNTTLDKLDDELLALKDEHRTLTEGGHPNAPKSAGSAAAAEGAVGADLVNLTEELLDELTNVPDTAFSKFRIGGYAVLNRSENPVFRWLGNVLLPDHVGAVDKNVVAKPSAILRGEQLQERVLGKYSAKYRAGYNKWATANGFRTSRFNPGLEDEFNRLVSMAVESGTDDANVKMVADAFGAAVKETFEYAQKSGVRGFDRFAHRNDYLPHIHNTEAFARVHTNLQAGPDGAAVEVIYQAMRRANEEMDDKLARKVAKKYVNTVLRKHAGFGGKYFDMNRVIDPDYARGMFEDFGMTEDEITSVLTMLSNAQKSTQAGGIARQKHRALLDMDTEITVFDQLQGESRQLRIRDLFEQNASKLMHSYVRSVGGWGAIADATKGTPIHITSPSKLESLLQKGLDWEVGMGGRTNKTSAMVTKLTSGKVGTGTQSVAESEVELIRMVTNSMTGIPINDPNSLMTIASRRLKDYSFTTMMGQVMWAQFSELGSTMAAIGWRGTLKAMPQLRRAMKRARDTGELDHELARVAEEFMGIGTTALRGRAHPMWVSDLDALDSSFNKWDSTLHVAKNVVAAPMHAMMTAQQRLMGMGMMQKFGDFAMGRLKLSDSELARLRQVGLSDKDLKNITAMYAKHAKWSKMQSHSGDLLNPNFDLWENQDAFYKLRDAIFRTTKRAVQENDMGNLPPMLSKNLASVLFQFRSFIFGAWEKHLLTNLHNRDFETFAQFTLQTLMSGLAYVGMTHTKSLGMDERARKRYLKERLSGDAIGKAAFARTGYSSVLPGAADTALWFAGYDGIFQHTRGSGLDQNFITGSPAVATVDRAYKAARGLIAAPLNPDYDYSRQDLSALHYTMPTANLLGIHNAWNMLGTALDLPYKSTDD